MNNKKNILEIAQNSILSQSKSIAKLTDFLDDNFINATESIYNCKGRLVVTGIGKSAIIAQKIVATMNSTGTPALFLHASEAIHGDLGMVQADDIIICISKSGNSPEIKVLVPLLKRFGNTLIAITGNMTSFLAKESHYVLNTTVDSEACPNNLAPTNSTTAQLVIGDALAICLMELRDFKAEDFAKYHPGGALGCAPEIMGIGPVLSSQKALERAGLSVSDLDIIELNEAFSAQSLACIREMNLDLAKINLDGGAIALGHPLGATGARITGKAAALLKREGKQFALASQCIGGGQGIATILEAV